MVFTKAQRLKGLKKQLRNLGYDVVQGSGPIPEVEEVPAEDEMAGVRGEHTVASLRARDEAW